MAKKYIRKHARLIKHALEYLEQASECFDRGIKLLKTIDKIDREEKRKEDK